MEKAEVFSGIYFLKQGDEIIYIGKSVDVNRRVLEHRLSMKFDNYEFERIAIGNLNAVEKFYVTKFQPKHNVVYGPHRTVPFTFRILKPEAKMLFQYFKEQGQSKSQGVRVILNNFIDERLK